MTNYINGVGQVAAHESTHVNGGSDELNSALDIRALASALYYGVSWDESQATGGYTRTGTLASIAVGSSPSVSLIPIQAAIRRCVMNDAGVVQYYLDPSDSTKRVGGVASVLTGADGQVMVEIPKFYYRYAYGSTTHTWEISQYPLAGFSVHPAFVKNGSIVDYRYIGAYEGVLYDASRSAYANGLHLLAGSTTFTAATKVISRTVESHPFTLLEVGDKILISGTTNNNGTFTIAAGGTGDQSITVSEVLVNETAANTAFQTEKDFANDILSSVSGKALINTGTRANFRALADKRGTGWRQQDFDLVSAIQLLYLIEYADWNSQSMIGKGLTDWENATWAAWNDLNPIEKTGNSNSDGNATANTSGGDGVTGSYMSYRGIENFIGHIWKFVDGFNINNNIPYICNVDTDFADDTATDYTALGVTMHNADGYAITLEQTDRGFLPASVGGSSSTYICAYYDQGTNWMGATIGGGSNDGGKAGIAFWNLTVAVGGEARYLGGRISF